MALTPTEQKLLNFAKGTLPQWFTDDEREMEDLAAFAKIMGQSEAQIVDWFKNALITTAVGPTAVDPDWLNQHAVDRGTARQNGETDVALRQRLRSVEDALTRTTLISAAQAIVDAEAIVGTVAMLEMPRDRAFFGSAASDTGIGGAFTAPDAGNVQRFTPAVQFAGIPFKAVEEAITHKLTTTGAANAANDVADAAITGLDGDAITFVNGGGALDAADAVVAWTIKKYDRNDNLLDGFADSYMGGSVAPGSADLVDRMNDLAPPVRIVLILPFGCTSGTRSSVLEMLRQKKGAGVAVTVECRLNA